MHIEPGHALAMLAVIIAGGVMQQANVLTVAVPAKRSAPFTAQVITPVQEPVPDMPDQAALEMLRDEQDRAAGFRAAVDPVRLEPVPDPAFSEEKPGLQVFAPYWDEKSQQALPDIWALESEHAVTVHANDTEYPVWVKELAARTAGASYPIMYWESPHGWRSLPWPGRAAFQAAHDAASKPAAVTGQPMSRYPTHQPRWNVDGSWHPSRGYLINHLLNGQHAGKFTRGALEGMTDRELRSLHDHDHEGTVVWAAVPGGRVAAPRGAYVVNSACPGGVCPTHGPMRPARARRGLLRGLFRR